MPGDNQCRECPAATAASFRSLTCERCDGPGEFSGSGSAYCNVATAGWTSSTRNDSAVVCPKDTYSSGGAGQCQECAEGYHSEQGSATCFACRPGTRYVEGDTGVKSEISVMGLTVQELEDVESLFKLLTKFEAPQGLAGKRTTGSLRMRAHFRAPTSGKFEFLVTSGSPSEVLFGKNSSAATKIASVPTSTLPAGQWDEFEVQASPPQDLVGGSYYYLELRTSEETAKLSHYAVGVVLGLLTAVAALAVRAARGSVLAVQRVGRRGGVGPAAAGGRSIF